MDPIGYSELVKRDVMLYLSGSKKQYNCAQQLDKPHIETSSSLFMK